ncbi:ankyrin repeat and SOCS box protein 3 [Platysternon megacephalum]|uniref:Ankyrin repeat and SOCS box protein 3 n=1 Tax=Platysternon megacephalum TaxID=55544 RepID=A0A4D9DXD6_9SAUR|nr:ankyrin repeat and SOCS box protein 3 [Platysternon megacephalum]
MGAWAMIHITMRANMYTNMPGQRLHLQIHVPALCAQAAPPYAQRHVYACTPLCALIHASAHTIQTDGYVHRKACKRWSTCSRMAKYHTRTPACTYVPLMC